MDFITLLKPNKENITFSIGSVVAVALVTKIEASFELYAMAFVIAYVIYNFGHYLLSRMRLAKKSSKKMKLQI